MDQSPVKRPLTYHNELQCIDFEKRIDKLNPRLDQSLEEALKVEDQKIITCKTWDAKGQERRIKDIYHFQESIHFSLCILLNLLN